ncbi:MAG: hypothetical protein V4621_04880 [Pseudomonadota bacterium]
MLRWLLLDMNSFFASCEQHLDPSVRGKPVGIVPMMGVDTTCLLAASVQAKKYGLRTGTPVGEAKQRCPDLILRPARHGTYTSIHNQVIAAIETCLPVATVLSVDEMACRLMGDETRPENARALALRIKAAIARDLGPCLTCSVGIAPNLFWAKVASDMQKPDGLIMLDDADLRGAITTLKLRDIIGIGPGMERRLHRAGIVMGEQLWNASLPTIRSIWGGVPGAQFYAKLHGVDLPLTPANPTRSLGHQHVLEPHLRNAKGVWRVARDLCLKATERLRRHGWCCTRMSVGVKFSGGGGYWDRNMTFPATQDSTEMVALLRAVFASCPATLTPLRVGVTLYDLSPLTAAQLDLWSYRALPERTLLMDAVDNLNGKYGRRTVTFGHPADSPIGTKTSKIAFQRVPEMWEVEEGR